MGGNVARIDYRTDDFRNGKTCLHGTAALPGENSVEDLFCLFITAIVCLY